MEDNNGNSEMNDEEGFTTNDEEPDDIDFPEFTSDFDFSSLPRFAPVTNESQATLNLVTPFYSQECNQHPFSYANLPQPSCSNWTPPVTTSSPVKENKSCIPQSDTDSFDYDDTCKHDDLSCICSNILAVNSQDFDIEQKVVDGTNNQSSFKNSHSKIKIDINVAQDMISTKESQPSTSMGKSSSKVNLKRDLQLADSHSGTSKKLKGLKPIESKYKPRSKKPKYQQDPPSEEEEYKSWVKSVNSEKGRRKNKDYINMLNEENGNLKYENKTVKEEFRNLKEMFEKLEDENKQKFKKLEEENKQLKSEIDKKNVQMSTSKSEPNIDKECNEYEVGSYDDFAKILNKNMSIKDDKFAKIVYENIIMKKDLNNYKKQNEILLKNNETFQKLLIKEINKS